MWGALYEPVYRYTPFHPNPDDNAEDALDMFDPARIDWGSNDEVVEKAYSSTLLNEEMASQFRTGEGPFTLAATQVPQVFAPVSWDNMTPGAKWVVIRMLSDNCPVPDEQPPREPRGFAQVVTTVLKLDRAQIQTFLAVYISDFESYQAWEYQTLEIPWAELLEEASEQNVSVMDLLPVGRPELCTDAISSQEVDQITSFLCGMHLDEFVAQASDWYGLNMSGDFVNLNVESDLLLDALDSALLRRVVALGWIKLAAIRAELQQQNRQPDPNSPLYELLSEQGASTDIQDAGAASQNPDAPADAPAEEDAGQPEDKVTKKRRPAGNKRKRKNGAAASSETVDENAESTEKTANTGRKGRGATKKKNINSNVGKSNAELPDGHPLKLDKNAKNNKKNGAVAAQVQRKVFPHGYASLDDKAREIAEAEYERTEPLTFMSGPELPGSSNFYIRTPSTMPVGPVAHPFEQSSDAAMSESTGPTLCSSQVGRSDDPKMNRRTRKPSRRVRENTEFKEDDTDVEFEFEYAPEQDGNKKRRKKNAVTKSNNAFKSSHIDETTDINGQVDQVADNYIIFNTTTVGQSMSTNMGTMPQGGVPAGLGSQSYHVNSPPPEIYPGSMGYQE